MKPVFERVAVLGLGLLGGSVALATRARGAARHVSGGTRSRDALDAALARGAIDAAGSYEEAVRDADLVVLATPVFAMGEVAGRIGPHLADGAIVTDVGSVKGSLAETLPGLLPPGARYVGSHPMAGSHLTGFEHARSDLFVDAPCVVIGDAGDAPVAQVAAFWRALGGVVVAREAVGHDAEVAWTSHLPHLVAFAFARALAEAPDSARALEGPGFRDFTRIARGDPGLWADILTANRKAIAAPLEQLRRALAEVARAVESGEPDAVERCVRAAHAALTGATEAPPARDGRASESNANPRSDGPPGAGVESKPK